MYLVLWPLLNHRNKTTPEDFLHFVRIAGAIEQYCINHQSRLPPKLSDLVPGFIDLDEVSVFCRPEILKSSSKSLQSDWMQKLELVDRLSDCVYLGTSGIPFEIIAYQRCEIKEQFRAKRLVITAAGTVLRVNSSDLEQLINGADNGLLEQLRQQHVVWYEANLHASLNMYRGEFGSYPIGDNALVIRHLRGDNTAKKPFHFRDERETNDRGEDIDAWGFPYYIEFDGKQVRIKSAGPNRTFDEVSSPGYDDICFSFANGAPAGKVEKF